MNVGGRYLEVLVGEGTAQSSRACPCSGHSKLRISIIHRARLRTKAACGSLCLWHLCLLASMTVDVHPVVALPE